MGDRAALYITFAKQDDATVRRILDLPPDFHYHDEGEAGLTFEVCEQISNGDIDCLQELAQAGVVAYGYHCAGSNFDAHRFWMGGQYLFAWPCNDDCSHLLLEIEMERTGPGPWDTREFLSHKELEDANQYLTEEARARQRVRERMAEAEEDKPRNAFGPPLETRLHYLETTYQAIHDRLDRLESLMKRD